MQPERKNLKAMSSDSGSSSTPPIPEPHERFIGYVNKQKDIFIRKLCEPYIKYEDRLRQLYAQPASNNRTPEGFKNLTPIFSAQGSLTIRQVDIDNRPDKNKHILPLNALKNVGCPVTVATFEIFQSHFNTFTNDCLRNLCWDNVLAAGGSVLAALQPINFLGREEALSYFKSTNPSSDIDLFLYGLDEEQAIRKMETIFDTIKKSNPEECISNTIDLSRRSPSYEHRLAKYAQRGFEIYWDELERDRIDGAIFLGGHFLQGLARLLMYEKAVENKDQVKYRKLKHDNFREPVDRLDLVGDQYLGSRSNYDMFEIPNEIDLDAVKLERRILETDIRLNSEQPVFSYSASRASPLHRHPYFVAKSIAQVVQDCCPECPQPVSQADRELLDREARVYVRGKARFIKDRPGRQLVGSFTPLSADDWTYDAYKEYNRDANKVLSTCTEKADEWVVDRIRSDPRAMIEEDLTGRTLLDRAIQYGRGRIVEFISRKMKTDLGAVHLAQLNGADMISTMLLEIWPQAQTQSENFPRVMQLVFLHGIRKTCTGVLQSSLSLPPKAKGDTREDRNAQHINEYRSALEKFAVEEWSLYCSAAEINVRAQAGELAYHAPISKQSDQICKAPDLSSSPMCRMILQQNDAAIKKKLPRLLKRTPKDMEGKRTLIQSFAFAILRKNSKAAQMIWDCVENKSELVRGPRIFLPPHIPKSIAPRMEHKMPDGESFEAFFDDVCKSAWNHHCIDLLHYLWATEDIEAQRVLEKICTHSLDEYSETETIIFAMGQNMIPLAEQAIKNCAIDRKVPLYTGPITSQFSESNDLARPARTTSKFRADRPLLFAAYYGNCDTLKHFFRKAMDLYDDDDNYESEHGKVLKDIYCPYDRWIRHRAYLTLHCAVLSPRDSSLDSVRYILDEKPEWLDLPSQTCGLTPLAVAFLSGNFNAAKHFINAKADFRTRDWHGRNLIHLALKHVTKSLNPDESSLSELLRLIPDSARREMFTEKSRTRTGLFTPLSYWIENLSANGRRPQFGNKVLRVLTSLGAKRSFHLYNGDGQSPLHQAVNAAFPSLVKALIRNEKDITTRLTSITILRTPKIPPDKKYGQYGTLFTPGLYVNTTSKLMIWEHASVMKQRLM
ncbi:MAG: hypothetical protein Q9188_001365 [Gyalolechia gomerana]